MPPRAPVRDAELTLGPFGCAPPPHRPAPSMSMASFAPRTVLFSLFVLLAALIVGQAAAHVTVYPPSATRGSYALLGFRVRGLRP